MSLSFFYFIFLTFGTGHTCEKIAHFNVEDKIASGGFGQVFSGTLCEDKNTMVVVKTRKYRHAECNQAILLEIDNITKLSQSMKGEWEKFFPKFYGSGSVDEQSIPCFVLEHLKGYELSRYFPIRSRKLLINSIKTVMHQTLQALKLMHRQGWAHRDVKLSNIMLTKESDLCSLKVVDFGLAKNLLLSEKHTLNIGTQGYVACEMLSPLEKKQSYGVEVDVYSLGKMLLHMLGLSGAMKDLALCELLRRKEEDSEFESEIEKRIQTPTSFFWSTALGMMIWNAYTSEYQDFFETFRMLKRAEDILGEEGFDFLMKMLAVDGRGRSSARELLTHPWLKDAGCEK